MSKKRKLGQMECVRTKKARQSTSQADVSREMAAIMEAVQNSECYHKKCTADMRRLLRRGYEVFVPAFIRFIKPAMAAEETNECALSTLKFCANFVSYITAEGTHPLMKDLCKWLLKTTSDSQHIRLRLCQFVGMLLKSMGLCADLEETLCCHITKHMLECLRDVSPSVRLQAIFALQRLQVPHEAGDPVVSAYHYHMTADPSPRVRAAVITCLGIHHRTLPLVMERLWDIDEKVRRHTYIHLSSRPVRSFRVAQRRTLLEQGLKDRSESVRRIVSNILVKNWLAAYENDIIVLIRALKLDATEADMSRFKDVTKLLLAVAFKQQSRSELIGHLPLEMEGEFYRCVPQAKLTIEVALYWQCLVEHFIAVDADEYDAIVPELSCFCDYVQRFAEQNTTEMDKFERMEHQHKLLSLMQMLSAFDLGDEIGRRNLSKLLTRLLKSMLPNEKVIEVIVRCARQLLTNQNEFLTYFMEIIAAISDMNVVKNNFLLANSPIKALVAHCPDRNLKAQVCEMRHQILALGAQETNALKYKDYATARAIKREKDTAVDDFSVLIQRLVEGRSTPAGINFSHHLEQMMNVDITVKLLQVSFHLLRSVNPIPGGPDLCKLYNEFICCHLTATRIDVCEWALKCATTYSMIHKEEYPTVARTLYSKLRVTHSAHLSETIVACLLELLSRHGSKYLEEWADGQRNSTLCSFSVDQTIAANPSTAIFDLLFHLLTECENVGIKRAIIVGFCRLVLQDQLENTDIILELFLLYFDPSSASELHQVLNVFMGELVARRKFRILENFLIPTVKSVLNATSKSPLNEFGAGAVAQFFIDVTRAEAQRHNGSVHSKFASIFLEEMLAHADDKALCKLLSSNILTLELGLASSDGMRSELKAKTDQLLECEFDDRTAKHLRDFKQMLDGIVVPQAPPSDVMGSIDTTFSDAWDTTLETISNASIPLDEVAILDTNIRNSQTSIDRSAMENA